MPYLASGILLFAVFFFVVVTIVVLRSNGRIDSHGLLRIYVIPLIVIAAAFLVVVGYTPDQISPIIGLLGSIAGYLLAKNTTPRTTGNRPAQSATVEEPKK